MPTPGQPDAQPDLAHRLLEAQVQWVLAELSGDRLAEVVARDVDDVLDAADDVALGRLVDVAEVKRVARHLFATVPGSVAATALVEGGADVVHEGPAEPFSLSELIARDHVEGLVDEALGLHDVFEKALKRLTQGPMVATLASRFVTRIVGEVLQANRTAAGRIPGVGPLVAMGTNAAGRVASAAQVDQLLGDTAGKGASFAARRLNRVAVDTFRDPMLREAVLEVWDDHADLHISDLGEVAGPHDVRRVAALLQDIVAAAGGSAPVGALVDAFIDMFFEVYGDYSVTTLLEELGIGRDDLAHDIAVFARRIVDVAVEEGHLERLVRERLEPFYRSPAVVELLG